SSIIRSSNHSLPPKHLNISCTLISFCLLIRRPPRSTLFPTRRSSDLQSHARASPRASARDGRSLFDRRDTLAVDAAGADGKRVADRKSTRLNSSHDQISYAVFCLKKKTNS